MQMQIWIDAHVHNTGEHGHDVGADTLDTGTCVSVHRHEDDIDLDDAGVDEV